MDAIVEPFLLLVQQMPWLALAWIAFLGGSIGSFMNVVVYRLPRKMSLSHPSSHCPSCSKPIRWYDNIPVFGWLRLRGRCRDCRAPIAPRYPFVEAMMTVVFVTLWLSDSVAQSGGSQELLERFSGYVWHVTLISVLACAALIDHDRQSVPAGLLLFLLAVLGLIAIFHGGSFSWLPFKADLAISWVAVSGAVVGSVMQCLCVAIAPRWRWPLPRWASIAFLAFAGLSLGPTRVACVVIASLIGSSLLPSMRWAAWCAMLTWVGVLFP